MVDRAQSLFVLSLPPFEPVISATHPSFKGGQNSLVRRDVSRACLPPVVPTAICHTPAPFHPSSFPRAHDLTPRQGIKALTLIAFGASLKLWRFSAPLSDSTVPNARAT